MLRADRRTGRGVLGTKTERCRRSWAVKAQTHKPAIASSFIGGTPFRIADACNRRGVSAIFPNACAVLAPGRTFFFCEPRATPAARLALGATFLRAARF